MNSRTDGSQRTREMDNKREMLQKGIKKEIGKDEQKNLCYRS